MDEDKKIGSGELLVFSFLFLFVDVICFLIDWTGVGMGITPAIQGFVLFFMDKFLMGKGSKSASKMGRKIAKYAIQLIPMLPTLVTTFIIEVAIHNNWKLVQVTRKKALSVSTPGMVAKIASKSVVS